MGLTRFRNLAARHLGLLSVLLAIVVPLTWAAVRVYPVLDDAGIELIVKENGGNAVAKSLPDRPAVGWIIQHAVFRSHFVGTGIVLQFTGWLLFGWVAARLYTELFPGQREFAPVVAGLTIAPILLKAQLATWTFVLPVNWAVLPAFAAVLLLLWCIRSGAGARVFGPSALAACAMTFAGGILSEYALLATLSASVLLLVADWERDHSGRPRVLQSFAVLGLAALGAHLIYGRLAVSHPDFTGVTFTPSPRSVMMHLPLYAMRLIRAFGFSAAGAYGQAIAETTAPAVSGGFRSAFLYPIAIAILFLWSSWRGGAETIALAAAFRGRMFVLVVSACIALAPAVLLPPLYVGRDLHMEEESTRYYFVAAPLVTSLTVRLLLEVTHRRFRPILATLAGFLAGSAVLHFIGGQYAHDQTMRSMGPVLAPYVRATTDQVVVLSPDFYARDPEMTYKASANWPAALSRRLMILWDERAPLVLGGAPADRGAGCGAVRTIDRNLRTIVRRGPIGELLWLQPAAGGGFQVEPYCLATKLSPRPRRDIQARPAARN